MRFVIEHHERSGWSVLALPDDPEPDGRFGGWSVRESQGLFPAGELTFQRLFEWAVAQDWRGRGTDGSLPRPS